MAENNKSGSPKMLDDGLRAGCVVSDEGNTKEFYGFRVPNGPSSAEPVRPCTKRERKDLNKDLFGDKSLKVIHCSPTAYQGGYLLYSHK